MTRQTGFVKEFKDVAFSLQEGEISEPFETDIWISYYLHRENQGSGIGPTAYC